jgi:hypothetical protein
MLPALIGVVAALHFLGLLYIVAGGFLAWRWRRAIYPHLPFALWGGLVLAGLNPTHPLTWLEDELREAAGMGRLEGGFNEHYIYGVLIPEPLLPAAAVLVSTLVVVSYIGFFVRWRRRCDQWARRDSSPS